MINFNYTEHRQKRVIYLVNKIADLPTGQTITPQFMEGYPFISFIDYHGKYTKEKSELEKDYLYRYLNENPKIMEKIDLIEIAWKYYLIYGTPNGDLYKINNIFYNLEQKRGLPLVHQTTYLKEIEKSGCIYQSSGCLGASVYCTPLRRDWKLHNLGQYIAEVEFPNLIKENKSGNYAPEFLIIWLDNENFLESSMLFNGVDYLYMGSMQNDLYQKFKSVYIDDYRDDFIGIEMQILKEIESVADFLSICEEYKMDDISDGKFMEYFEKSKESVPVLRYAYFEVLSEYVSMFQNDYESTVLHESGELNNINYKNMVYDLCPCLKKAFKLTEFCPTLNEVSDYLSKKRKIGKVINDFSKEHFIHFFKWRFAQYMRTRYMDSKTLPKVMSVDSLMSRNPSLIGHIVHRKMRNHFTIKKKTKLYDVFRSRIYWNYWNENNVVIPYNSIIPKGEIGINPTFPGLSYKVYEAKLNKEDYTLGIERELKVEIVPELVSNDYSNLRKHIT